MALSNLWNEPRREITEQAVGLSFIIAFVAIDYGCARFFGASTAFDIGLYMWFGAVGMGMVGIFLTIVTHSIGETVCG